MKTDRDMEIVEALLNDHSFQFKESKDMLQYGRCPNCNRKSVWVSKARPGRIQCNHETSCSPHYSVTPKELYPDLFTNYAERFPATTEDPKATARNYLADRGFNTAEVSGWYEQGYFPLTGGRVAPTVRITLWNDFYWERLIDDKHIGEAGRKNSYKKGIKYSGKHWQPPGFELNENDECVITEGIFNAWVFLHLEKKAVASLSSGNFPAELVSEHRRKGIVWILAYDNDVAGLKHMQEYIKKLREMGERYQVMLTRSQQDDWNDDFQKGLINDKYLSESLWRGRAAMQTDPRKQAFWQWVRRHQGKIQVELFNSLYAYKVEGKASKEVYEVLEVDNGGLDFLWEDIDARVADAFATFSGFLTGGRISNCIPRFLYIERDPLTDEQDYFFKVRFRNGNPTRLIALDGSSLESASSLNKALLGKTSGGTFDGEANDIKRLKEQWFDHKTTEITRLRFVGYDKATQTWVYPEFGFHNGRFIPVNEMGYLSAGAHKVKTKVSHNQIKMIHKEHLSESWIGLFEKTFGPNGFITMAWWLCTLYAEHIREKYQDWPFFELTGDPGTGKTTLLKFLWRCVGRIDGYEGFDPAKSSVAGRSRTLERYSALPTVVIEADRKDDKPGAKKGFDFNEFKDFFNGGIIRTTGVKNGGNETVEPPYRGGVLIAQNASVDSDDDAVMERIVHCHSTKAHHTADSKQYARQMASMKTEEVAGWLHKALTSEKVFLETFDKKLTEVQARFHLKTDVVRERIIENHAKVSAGIWCLQILFPEHMTDEKCQTLEQQLWDMAVTRERRIKSDSPLVEQFWEYFEELNWKQFEDHDSREYVTAQQLNHHKNEEYIAINLVDFERLISKQGLRISISELKKQLPNCQTHPFVGRKTVNSQITGNSKKCWVFRREAS